MLKNIAYIINDIKDENTVLFRLQGASFACYLPHTTKEAAVEFADKIRNAIGNSEKFIQKITVSIGVACLDEIKGKNLLIQEPSEGIYGLAVMRVKIAKNMGGNIVCSSSSVESYQEHIGKILVVDTDEGNIDVLKTSLKNINYKVFTAKDGEEALNIGEREVPDTIISEIMLPKIDGFLLREKLLMQSYTKNIPFYHCLAP